MTDVWSLIATQIPAAVAIALLVLQMRKSESEERHANTDKWQAFLKQRDEQWQAFLTTYGKLEETVIGSLIGQMCAVGKQMEAVTAQMQAVLVAVEKFATMQEYATAELRSLMTKYEGAEPKNDNQQPRHP